MRICQRTRRCRKSNEPPEGNSSPPRPSERLRSATGQAVQSTSPVRLLLPFRSTPSQLSRPSGAKHPTRAGRPRRFSSAGEEASQAGRQVTRSCLSWRPLGRSSPCPYVSLPPVSLKASQPGALQKWRTRAVLTPACLGELRSTIRSGAGSFPPCRSQWDV